MDFPTDLSKARITAARGWLADLELTLAEECLADPEVHGTPDADAAVDLLRIHMRIIRGDFEGAASDCVALYDRLGSGIGYDPILVGDVRGTMVKVLCELAGPESAEVVLDEGPSNWHPLRKVAWGRPGPGFYADGACLEAFDDLAILTPFRLAWRADRINGAGGRELFARMLFRAGRADYPAAENADLFARWLSALQTRVGEVISENFTREQLDEFDQIAHDEFLCERFVRLYCPRYELHVFRVNLALAEELRTGRKVLELPAL